ncbi:MAG TPA: hypothetical protein VG248_18890 [Caulobacteraceae bacterium]|jgi:hypothetical protein|nr:hypothetical protein [Caulobacteraceae bacterium]
MSDDRRRILSLLAEGRIDADQADRLISALQTPAPSHPATASSRAAPKFLRVEMDADRGSRDPARVNVRVPMALLRAGVRLSYLMPPQARAEINAAFAKKGIAFDIDRLKPENLEELIAQLGELQVDMQAERSKVRVYCE